MSLHVLVPVLAIPSGVLCTLPLIAHVQNRNFATVVLVLAVMLQNLQIAANALIWPSNDTSTWWDGAILCDIEVKLFVGLTTAVIGAIVSILRQVASIVDTTGALAHPSPGQRLVTVLFEGLFCALWPLTMMVLHYVVQPDRYWILPIDGCTASFDNNWLTFGLIFLLPVLGCLLGSVYCVIASKRILRHRREMAAVLSYGPTSSSQSNLQRLFGSAVVLLLCYSPLGIYSLAQNAMVPHHPFDWDFIHPPDWNARILKMPEMNRVAIDRYLQIASGYICFAFLGLGYEGMHVYRSWVKGLKQKFSNLKTKARSNIQWVFRP